MIHCHFSDFLRSGCFWSAFLAWCTAQFTKMLVGFYRTRRLDFSYMVSTGGMPSAHSAMVCGLATSLGITVGFGHPLFILGMGFALITMFDASTVRRAAGQQAKLLNQMVDAVFKEHRYPGKKLKELLGHTRFEVFMGMIIGILVAMLIKAIPVNFDW